MLAKTRRALSPEPTPKQIRERAEARLKLKERQKADAPVALQQYRAAEQALRDRTAALRAQRLAREAAGVGKQKKPSPSQPSSI
jgi:hypothetical protein